MATPGSKWLFSVALGVAISTSSMATAQAAPAHAIGVCEIATSGTNGYGVSIATTDDASTYLAEYYPNKHAMSFKEFMTGGANFDGAPIKILAEPRHGKLFASDSINDIFRYTYVADKGFSGEDTFVLQVEKYGLKIQVHYTIEVPEDNEGMYGRCDPPLWKISQMKTGVRVHLI